MAKYPRQVVIHNPLWEFMRYCEVYCNYACCGEAAFEVHHALILRKVIDENLGGGHGDQSFELAWRQLRDLIVFLDTTELINLDHGLPIWSEEETEFPQYWVSKDSYQSWLETWNDAFEKASSYMAPNSEASLYEKDKVGHLDKFKSDREFIEFLNDHKIPAVASSHAHSSSLTWWQDEQHEGLFDVALLNGGFFLLATDKTLELYVLDFKNCWFDLVKVWQRNISKHIFAYELRKIIYEVDKDIWFHVRKTGLDRGLKKKLDKIGI